MDSYNASRRRFARNLLQSAGFLSLSLGRGRLARAAQDALANPDPRFLINIHTRGGADTMWWQSYSPVNDERFPRDQAIPHPLRSNHLMGIGMSLFSRDDFSRMAIWKGMIPEGDHDIGNRIVNCGMFSNYAACFSSHVSAALAKRSAPLPLHYVQVSKTPQQIYAWPGLLTGYAHAVNIADPDQFTSLTGTLPWEVAMNRRAALDKAIERISGAALAANFRLSQSRSYFQNFLSSFKAMNQVYGSGLGASPAFKAVRDAYVEAARSAFQELTTRYPALLPKLAEAGYPGALDQPWMPLCQKIAGASFSFAMGEFLVTHGLSRVVDIGPSSFNEDAHAMNNVELASHIAKYGMLRALIRRLADPAVTGTVPGTPGNSFIRHATVVMTTEYDRELHLSLGVVGQPFGTNHGGTTSVILAGRGIKGGSVVGDIQGIPGPSGRYPAFTDIPYGSGLPVNLDTGEPDLSGVKLTTKSIFATMMAMFDVTIPSEQMNEGRAFRALLG